MKKILIVDDSEQNRIYLQTLFQSQGFAVTVAANGAYALDTARKDPPHIVITDILMPVMDGFMLCREWRKDNRLNRVPFVFYTATYTESKDEKLAMDLGADLFIIKPQEPEVLLTMIQKVLADNESKKNGTPSEVKISKETVLEEYNEVLFRKLERKIHQLEIANQAIADSEKKLRLITEKMTDIVWTADLSLRTTYVSPSIQNVLGFTPAERMRQPFNEQLTPASLSLGLEALAGELTLEGQQNVDPQRKKTLVLEFYHKDGSTRWLETIMTGIRSDQGVLIGLHGVSRDITERKQAEDKLRESEEKYRELIEYAPAGIYEVDYETNLFKSVNDIICEYTGYTRDELLKMNIVNLLTKESQELMSERLKKLFAGEKIPDSVEYCIQTKSGEILWALLRTRYIYKGKKLKGATGVIYNITDRKKNEEEMKKREEELSLKSKNLEEMNSTLKVLLKKREEDRITIEENVLANVKTFIFPYIEKLKKGSLTEHQRTCLKMIEEQARELTAPFLHTISQASFDLTPQELRVADLVKNGNTTKEIADVLGISTRTVDSHRKNLRIKLGIKNDKTNLRSFLMKFS